MEMADQNDDMAGANNVDEIVRNARAAKEDLTALASAVSAAGRSIAARVDIPRRMREEPVKTMAIAFGVGYVAGGGFFTPTTGRIVRLATRLWLLPALRRELSNQQEYH